MTNTATLTVIPGVTLNGRPIGFADERIPEYDPYPHGCSCRRCRKDDPGGCLVVQAAFERIDAFISAAGVQVDPLGVLVDSDTVDEWGYLL